MRTIERQKTVYSPTLIQIPLDLKQRAKRHGLVISRVCNEALARKVEEIEESITNTNDELDGIPET